MKFAAIEGGGTTWVCAIVEDGIDNFIERVEFYTTSNPEDTLGKIRAWLGTKEVDAIGVASFGPVDAKKGSPTYGFITSTPKPGWKNTDVLRLLGLYDEFKHIPVVFDTDVNAPAMAEYTALKSDGDESLTSCCYITVGTGIGVGLVINGATVKGLLHPEGGHLLVRPQEGDNFAGSCPFHGACVEGMCSNGAMAARLGINPSELPTLADDHPIWDTCAHYLAATCVNVILIASPERIIFGGGVLKRTILYEKIRKQTLSLLNSYIISDSLTPEKIGEFIGPSRWGDNAGLVGAAYLARQAFDTK